MSRLLSVWALCALVSSCASIGEAQATKVKLDPAKSADALTMSRKIQCSTVDNEPVIYWWHGPAYSRRQGEKDRHLFNVDGMNIRACSTVTDERGNKGFHLVSRELLIYRDKDTGEALKIWTNPWTNETVNVLHVANDPVNFKSFEVGRDGKPVTFGGEIVGESWWLRSTFPLWYENPLSSSYEKEIGGTYHATEMFDFFGRADELLDPKTTTVKATVGWARMSDWLPWMNMNGREGVIYFHTAGKKLSNVAELPAPMRDEIARYYPDYASPPPAGDPRPNMTSWKYYQGVREGKITPPAR
jgi:hypothetical protein